MNRDRTKWFKVCANGLTFIVEVVERFFDDNCPQLAAALAYYAIFSIPPLLVLVAAVLGVILDGASVSSAILQGTSGFLAPEVPQQLVAFLERANAFARTGPWWSVALSIVGVMFGATRGFNQLQTAINRAWSIYPDPQVSIIRTLLLKRLISFIMVATTILLLIVLLAVSAFVAFFGERLAPFLPSFVAALLYLGIDALLSVTLASCVLAALYRWLPDARISWSQVLPGALCAAVLFQILQSTTTFYLSRLELADTFGQAASFALLLIWLYLCANVVFIGAEFAQVWSIRRGNPVRPDLGSVRDGGTLTKTLTSKLQAKLEAMS